MCLLLWKPVNLLHYLPNSLSITRLVLGFAFPFFPTDWRLWVVIIAAISDVFDGLTARWLHAESKAGRLLDPIADKVFILMVALTLLAEGAIHPLWAAGVAARDLVVLVGVGIVTVRRSWSAYRKMRPKLLGKITTVAQFAVLLVLAAWGSSPAWLLIVTTVLSVLAGIDYAREFVKRMIATNIDTPS
ncbi:MAG: CDP-alcohol phosphatidyltransferase family protein [Planctomycetia bacterium]|nr:CDP-alcohol phosphatidyltransferase family protein [Planctomycetia bacterium]